MEYEIESLIMDLELPRDLIQQDVENGRLRVYQHNDDEKFYVDAEDFVNYAAERVVELPKPQQRIFWLAVRKIVTNPAAPRHLSEDEMRAVIAAIDGQIKNCS